MISRIWRWWTSADDADAYEELLRTEILPGIAERRVDGYRGAHLLRRDLADGVEFVTLCWFESMDAVREFAGERPEVAVVPESARLLLDHFDATAQHYETLLDPEDTRG